MAEEDVDIAAFSDDEVVDLTVDDDDWDDIEVAILRQTSRPYSGFHFGSVLTCTAFVWQDFSDLEQDLEETTAEDSRQGKDMQVAL